MRVQEIMRKLPKSCGPGTNLSAATEVLWSGGCGALPVVDASGKVIGIITDRDICVAVGTRDQRPSELVAEQAMSRKITTCRPSDDIHAALKVMRASKVRRVPVVSDAGKLVGMLCLSDLILYARHDDGSRPELSDEHVMGVLKAIYWSQSQAHSPVVSAAR
jgi:CBS domain-containing protein